MCGVINSNLQQDFKSSLHISFSLQQVGCGLMQLVFLCDLWLDKTKIRLSIVLQSNCQDYQDKWSTPSHPLDEQTQTRIEKVRLGETVRFGENICIMKHSNAFWNWMEKSYAENRKTQTGIYEYTRIHEYKTGQVREGIEGEKKAMQTDNNK